MQSIKPPPQGYNPAMIAAKLQALNSAIEDYQEIVVSKIVRATIVVDYTHPDQGPVRKVFQFPPGTVTTEIADYFEATANRLASERNIIEAQFSMYRVGNKMVELGRFIETMTAGEVPAVDGLELKRMQEMQPGEKTIITVEGEPTEVQRIS